MALFGGALIGLFGKVVTKFSSILNGTNQNQRDFMSTQSRNDWKPPGYLEGGISFNKGLDMRVIWGVVIALGLGLMGMAFGLFSRTNKRRR